jgi:hypothetical protein
MSEKIDEAMPLIVGGGIIGAVITGLICTVTIDTGLKDWAYDHEALAAGILGVLAASFTALILIWQISVSQEFQIVQRRRRLAAARSTFPLVLSELTDYTGKCFKMSLDMAAEKDIQPALPDISPTHIDVFKECIEQANEKDQAKLSLYLREFQVQRSRLQGAIDSYRPSADRSPDTNQVGNSEKYDRNAMAGGGYVYSSALLALLTEELWGFARNDDSSSDIKSRAERIEKLFFFDTDYDVENFPTFVSHFKRTADKK